MVTTSIGIREANVGGSEIKSYEPVQRKRNKDQRQR